MRRGFVTEVHVVVYCDSCGELFTDADGESVCFDTRYQAIAFLTFLPGRARWVYDGDKIVCNGCRVPDQCEQTGHAFTDSHGTTARSHGTTSCSRLCLVCGTSESEPR